MKNFKAIEDIRINIDKIDIEILNLIEKRKNLVDRVVKLKTKDEIVDQKRIDSILKKLDEEAKKKMLPSKMIKDIWEKMINGFIEYEKRYFEK
jgi:isochorismate pyruvate lyase